MLYKKEYYKQAHLEIEHIFRELFPKNGFYVREEQIRLCHEMLDALLDKQVILCDAGVGIGKTYAYLVACVLMRKYSILHSGYSGCDRRTVVISTSSIALQKAVIEEYVPFLSRILIKNHVIDDELRTVIRKGKEHFVCDYRLTERLKAIKDKDKNEKQFVALRQLIHNCDLDTVRNLSNFDRRMVCVPKFCSKDCPDKKVCRYQMYLKESQRGTFFLQVCNHNYLLADTMHRAKGYRPLLADYRALVVDEAHKLTESASQMYGRSVGSADIQEIVKFLNTEHKVSEGKALQEWFGNLQLEIQKEREKLAGKEKYYFPEHCFSTLEQMIKKMEILRKKLTGNCAYWGVSKLEEIEEIFQWFLKKDSNHVLFLQDDHNRQCIFMAVNKKIPYYLNQSLWEKGIPAILTSGTLKAGDGFERTKKMLGLEKTNGVKECVAESPFHYEKNCLLYIPEDLKKTKKGSKEEATQIAGMIRDLICSTYGHTLVLFTSYSLMGSVQQALRDQHPFPVVQVWRHSQEEISRFKTLNNAVMFAAGTCWEGLDFPGDSVSSLIIVKLPFAVPDPVHEAEKERYDSLEDYIKKSIVPDMQKKLRQGFGRAIRTETDTCVVSILDSRASLKGKYRKEVLSALPTCKITSNLKDVETFIQSRKGEEYYL